MGVPRSAATFFMDKSASHYIVNCVRRSDKIVQSVSSRELMMSNPDESFCSFIPYSVMNHGKKFRLLHFFLSFRAPSSDSVYRRFPWDKFVFATFLITSRGNGLCYTYTWGDASRRIYTRHWPVDHVYLKHSTSLQTSHFFVICQPCVTLVCYTLSQCRYVLVSQLQIAMAFSRIPRNLYKKRLFKQDWFQTFFRRSIRFYYSMWRIPFPIRMERLRLLLLREETLQCHKLLSDRHGLFLLLIRI